MDRQTAVLVAVVLAPSAMLVACVSKTKFDAAVDDAQTAHTALAGALDREKADEAQIAKLQDDLDAAQAQVQARDQKLSDLSTSSHNLQAQLDEETAINAKLRGELERLGKNVDQMLQGEGHAGEGARRRQGAPRGAAQGAGRGRGAGAALPAVRAEVQVDDRRGPAQDRDAQRTPRPAAAERRPLRLGADGRSSPRARTRSSRSRAS